MEMERQEQAFEEEATLQLRKARTAKNERETTAADSVEGNNGDVEHEVQQEMAANGTEKEDLILEDEQKIEGVHEVLGNGKGPINGEHESENIVFYDKVEVVNLNGGKTGMIDIEHEANGSSFVFGDEGNSASIVDRKAEDLGFEDSSNSKLQQSEISAEESSKSYQISSEIERVEDDPITVDDLEVVTDYDVEGVLQKQNTHDLYCPNCKSCITRRVVLRKRKRTIRNSGEEVKKNKVEATAGDKVGVESSVHHPEEVAIDGSQVPAVDDDDDDRDREPFIFKCLSCFTFFIPIGFRDRSAKEPIQGQQPSNSRKNWSFASMFSTNKLETTDQGIVKRDVKIHGVRVSASANLGDRNAQTSKSQTTAHTSNGLSGTTLNNVNLDFGDDKIIPSPEKKSSSEGKGNLSAANELDSTTVETIVTNGVPEGHGKGRSKLLISSDKESTSMKALEGSQKPNLTSETDKEDILLPASISVHRDADNDGRISISMAVPQEQQQDFTATIVTESIIDEKNANEKAGLAYRADTSQHITTKTQIHVHSDETLEVDSISSTVSNASAAQGKDTLITIDVHPSKPVQDIIAPPETSTHPSAQISLTSHQERSDQAREEFQIEIVKSIVYGGLAESIASLSVVSSAAGGGAKTLNILALGMANLFGGLLILCHNVWELRSDNTVEAANQVSDIQEPQIRDRYRETLGRIENFILHFFLSLTSYLVFGLVPPLAYGFSFRKSDDTEGKLLVVAASSLVCICLLAIGRAYVQRPPKPYIKSVTTFVILGFFVSGVSYAAGILVERLLERLGLFNYSASLAGLLLPETVATSKTWASY